MTKWNPKIKKVGIHLIKLLVATGILYFVYTKIDLKELKTEVSKISWLSLLFGILFFSLSKVLASFRLTYFIRKTGYVISQLENLQLYALGMFYNLFLPGGIGGDGYKVYYLNKNGEKKTKDSVWPFLLDRASGMFSLAVLVLLLGLFIPQEFISYQKTILIALILAGSCFTFLFIRLIKKEFLGTFIKTLIWSFLSQLAQVACISIFLFDLNETKSHIEYQLLFLISSLISVIPISPGGLGLRELTYKYGASFFNTQETTGIMLGSLFFVISSLVSLSGIYFHFSGVKKLSN